MPRNIIITPHVNDVSYNPRIDFVGASTGTIHLEVLENGAVSFIGNYGQLFSIVDDASGSLMSVNNISGLPIFETWSTDQVDVNGFLKVDGSIRANSLSLLRNPVNASDAINKGYIDASLRLKIDVSVVSVANNDTIKYSSAYAAWQNKPDFWNLAADNQTVSLYNPSTYLELSSIELQDSGGELTFTDMPMTNASTGSLQSYSMNIDGSVALKIYGVGNASTSLRETAVVMQANYLYFGDPNTDGVWRFKPSGTTLIFERRTSGSWVEEGKFF